MEHCCEHDSEELKRLRERQGKVLRAVLGINAAMFVVEFGSGWFARSTALLGDSLDMLGDTSVYALSLYALHRGPHWQAWASLTKGIVMLGFGAVVCAEAIGKLLTGAIPAASIMGAVGLLALAANALCFFLLARHRQDDLNMHSTWICSRNDLIANGAVLLAAAAVAHTGSPWPDVAVGLAIAGLFLHSAWGVIRRARDALRTATAPG